MAQAQSQHIEKEKNFVLIASCIYLCLGIYSFISSGQSNSPSLELNGYYNTVGAIVSFLSVILLGKIQNGGTHKFAFGYERFIPLLTLIEGVMIFSVSQNACAGASSLLFGGGSESPISLRTLTSAAIISLLYLGTYILHRKHLKIIGENQTLPKILISRVKVILTYSVATTFLFTAALMIQSINSTSIATRYVEPVAVFVLVSLAMKGPMNQIFGSINQLLMGSPSKKEFDIISNTVDKVLREFAPPKYLTRATKLGETLYLNITFHLNENQETTYSAIYLQKIRNNLQAALSSNYPIQNIELIFTS